MRTRLWAGFGLVLVVIAVAVINSRRAQHDRAIAVPAPTVTVVPTPRPVAQDCDLWPGRGATEEAHVPFGTASHPDLVVVSVRCVDISGERQPSLVKVLDVADDHRIVATLIRLAQNLQVYEVAADSRGVVVTALEAGPPLPGEQKSAADTDGLFRWRFATVDGIRYTESDPVRAAFACRPADLTLTARPGVAAPGARLPSVAVIGLRNASAKPCAIEGYPQVTGFTAGHQAVVPNLQLSGTGGGLRSGSAPDIVLLNPGETTSAAVDSADETPAGGTALCNTLASLDVSLPSGSPVGTVPVSLRVCEFQVHPLVRGPTGISP
jgi:hypothetical protein